MDFRTWMTQKTSQSGTVLDPMGNVVDGANDLTRMERSRRMASNTFNSVGSLGGMAGAGLGMPINPFSFAQSFTSMLGIGQQYQSQARQTTAFLSGGRGGKEDFNAADLNKYADALNKIGATKSTVLSVMQEMASLSRQVSSGLDKAAISVLAFSKATGIDSGVSTRVAGSAFTASNMDIGAPGAASRLLENVRGLAGGDSNLFEPISQAVQAFREMRLSSGSLTEFDERSGIDNAMRVQAGMQGISEQLYQRRSDLGVSHFAQTQAVGSSVLFGFAMDAAAAAGLDTDIVSVKKYLREGQTDVIAGVMESMGDNADMLAFMEVSPGYLQNLQNGGADRFRAGADGFAPDVRSEIAIAATGERWSTRTEQARADIMNQIMGNFEGLVDTTAAAFEKINVKMALGVTAAISFADKVISLGGLFPASGASGVAQTVGGGVAGATAARYGPTAARGIMAGLTAMGVSIAAKGGVAAALASNPVGWVTAGVLGTAALGYGGYRYYKSRNSPGGGGGWADDQQSPYSSATGRLAGDAESRVASADSRLRAAYGDTLRFQVNARDKDDAEEDADRRRNIAAGATGSARPGSPNRHTAGNAADLQVINTNSGRTVGDPRVLTDARHFLQGAFNREGERVAQVGSASGVPHFHIDGLNAQLDRAAASLSVLADTASRAAGATGTTPRSPSSTRQP